MSIEPMKPTTPWRTFARKLFDTEDSDPGYMAIARCGLPEDQVKRLIVGWLTFYDLGFAASISHLRDAKFWAAIHAAYPTAKRNSERRHFRGAAGLKALTAWQKAFPYPELMIDRLRASKPHYVDIRKRMRSIPQMGDYFMWKMCDLYDVLTGVDVEVEGQEHHAPKVPQEGAKLLWERAAHEIDTDHCDVAGVFRLIVQAMEGRTAPPHHNRPFGLREAETVCCIYHKLRSGKYILGMRTAKARGRLMHFKSEANEALLAGLMLVTPFEPTYLDAVLAKD